MPSQTEAGRLVVRAACLILVQDAVSGDGIPRPVEICIGRLDVPLLTLQSHPDNRCRKKTTS